MLLSALLALLPLGLLVLGMTRLRWPTWRAALPALALLAAQAALHDRFTAGAAGRALADAALLTAIVGETLFFGLLLHEITARSGALDTLLGAVRGRGRDTAERLMWVLLVLAPAFESVSGFGLGVMIAAPLLLALGYGAGQTLVLALVSQLAVPWGALAIGMTLGAELAGLPLAAVGAATAVLAAFGYVAFWGLALRVARPAGGWPVGAVLRAWLGLGVFACGVWAANRWGPTELGGLGGAALLAAWLWRPWRGRAPIESGGLVSPGRSAAVSAGGGRGAGVLLLPYALLVVLLGVTRFVPALQEWLTRHAVVTLPHSTFSLPLLYNPGAALAAACAVAVVIVAVRGAFGGAQSLLAGAVRSALGRWWVAAVAVFLLALLARGMVEVGHIGALADAAATLPAPVAPVGVVVPALLGGFLTGSVAGANSLFMDLLVRIAAAFALPATWSVALFQVLAAAATAFSPARLVFAAVMTGRRGREGEALRPMAPVALALLALGLIAANPVVLEGIATLSPWLLGR